MAAAAVFETYELLENILTQLPPKDIRIAQHVTQQWRSLVKRSQSIRVAWCLGVVTASRDPGKNETNKDKQQLCNRTFVGQGGRLLKFSILVPAKVNPFFERIGRGSPTTEFEGGFEISDLARTVLGDERMQYVSEPPISIVYLDVMLRTRMSHHTKKKNICHTWKPVAHCSMRIPTGVTIQDVADCVKLLRRSCSGEERISLTCNITAFVDREGLNVMR